MEENASLIDAPPQKKVYSEDEGVSAAGGSTTKLATLQEFFEHVGNGKTQYFIWIISFLVGYADYSELLLISLIIPYLRCHWELSQTFEVSLSFCLFGSYALFSYFIAQQADRLGRKMVVIGCTVVLVVASIIPAVFDSKWAFMATRLFTGASVGANVSVLLPYTVEVSQNSVRAVGPLMFNVGVLVSVLSINFQGLLFLDSVGYQWFIIILTIPLFVILGLLIYMPESPRYLLVAGRSEELKSTLTRIAAINGSSLENVTLDIQASHPTSASQLGSLRVMLSGKLRRNILSLMFYYAGNICIEFGLVVLLPLLFTASEAEENKDAAKYTCEKLTKDDFYKLMYSSVAGITGFAIFIIFMQRIGRLFALRLSAAATCLVTFALYFHSNPGFILAIVLATKFFEAGGNATYWVAIQELVPTTVRSTAVGFINSAGKVAGMIGTCAVYLLFYKSYTGLITLFLFFQVAGFIGTIVFNKESKDSAICDTYDDLN